MLDFCAEHGLGAEIELIRADADQRGVRAGAGERRPLPLRDRHGDDLSPTGPPASRGSTAAPAAPDQLRADPVRPGPRCVHPCGLLRQHRHVQHRRKSLANTVKPSPAPGRRGLPSQAGQDTRRLLHQPWLPRAPAVPATSSMPANCVVSKWRWVLVRLHPAGVTSAGPLPGSTKWCDADSAWHTPWPGWTCCCTASAGVCRSHPHRGPRRQDWPRPPTAVTSAIKDLSIQEFHPARRMFPACVVHRAFAAACSMSQRRGVFGVEIVFCLSVHRNGSERRAGGR